MPKRGDSREYALTETEVNKVLKTVVHPLDRVLFGFSVFGGLRISETVHIRPSWLKNSGEIDIPPQMICKCTECRRKRDGLWKPKTKSGIRTIAIPEWVPNLALKQMTVEKGLNITRVGAWGRIKKLLQESHIIIHGLAGNTSFPHALRATCATLLAANGANASAICYHMGWSDLRVAEHYIKLAESKNLAHRQVRAIFG